MALLEADVNFKVVKNFIKSVEERAIGQDVMSSLTPGQMVIKIVNEEVISLMGSETTEIKLKSGNEITVIMMQVFRVQVRQQQLQSLLVNLRKKVKSLYLLHVMFTGQLLLSS